MTAQQTRPRLENGDVMTREEFHRLYSQCEGLERVELIEGVVYMPSPIRIEGHAREQKLMTRWLEAYEELHDGVEAMTPGSVLLDDDNEPEPDVMLYRLRPGRFEDGYLNGAPELVVEIAALQSRATSTRRNAPTNATAFATTSFGAPTTKPSIGSNCETAPT
jgi:Uma2 family endonuclease